MISIKHNKTSIQEVLNILNQNESIFSKISSRQIDIIPFANKLFKNSEIFGAYDDSIFCGFIAFYCNDFISKSAYISIILLSQQYRKMGIGSKLLESVISYTTKIGMKTVMLEMRIDNIAGSNTYKKFGFKIIKENNHIIHLQKDLAYYNNY